MANPIEAVIRPLDRFQQRRRFLAFPYAVVKKFGDDEAGSLAPGRLAWSPDGSRLAFGASTPDESAADLRDARGRFEVTKAHRLPRFERLRTQVVTGRIADRLPSL
jgi:hypothetical protein